MITSATPRRDDPRAADRNPVDRDVVVHRRDHDRRPRLRLRCHAGGSGGGAGEVAVHDIQITKPTDKSSPKLFLACANGQHFKKATLTVRKAGKQVAYTLSDVLIASAQSTGHGEKLTDSLTLNYAKLTIQTGKPHA